MVVVCDQVAHAGVFLLLFLYVCFFAVVATEIVKSLQLPSEKKFPGVSVFTVFLCLKQKFKRLKKTYKSNVSYCHNIVFMKTYMTIYHIDK